MRKRSGPNTDPRRAPDSISSLNKISISLLTPRSDKLNSKASEVNNRLINMCSHRNIAYIDYSTSIQQNNISECKVYLNRYGAIVFANSLSKFLIFLIKN